MIIIPTLLILFLVTASFHIYFDHKKKYSLTYIFKPLTILLIILLAMLKEQSLSNGYKAFIISGLFFSLIGDIFLMIKDRDLFTKGLLAFLIAHITYIFAILYEFGLSFNFYVMVGVLSYFSLLLYLILPNAGSKRLHLIFYSCAIGFLLVQGSSLLAIGAIRGMIFIGVGILLFAISDSVLAYNKFAKKFKLAQLIILSTYYLAQIFIALSI